MEFVYLVAGHSLLIISYTHWRICRCSISPFAYISIYKYCHYFKNCSFYFSCTIDWNGCCFYFSVWFQNSFRKELKFKLLSILIILGVFVFWYLMLETNPANIKSHYGSYFLKVVFILKISNTFCLALY